MVERYKILKIAAGEGGFGRVDKAHDTELERDVAIKVLDPIFKIKPSSEDIERFRREARALARLSHPNIPAIYDVIFSEEDEEFEIIFEWIEGISVREFLKSRGLFTLEEARRFFSQICSALSHAHESKIIHRDIKPSNLILTPDLASCYLVDFGIALSDADLKGLTGGTPVGTPGYMSPEQEKGEDLGFESDVFQLGILLYECLSGTRPTVGGYRSLSMHNESIPPLIDNLIQEALREDRTRRLKSAKTFSDKLYKALRPHSNFTSTLADGSLHEIQIALTQMAAGEFAGLPPGQRVLIMSRLNDLTRVDEPRMRNAVASFVSELVRVGHEANMDHYKIIIEFAFSYGYEKQYGETWFGNDSIRFYLAEVILSCIENVHEIITNTVVTFFEPIVLSDKQKWYLHDLRILLQSSLTNPVCTEENSKILGNFLTDVNVLSHETTG